METDLKQRNKDIKYGPKLALLYMIVVLGLSPLLSNLMPAKLNFIPQLICPFFGVALALRGKCAPEKGTLLAENKKMTGTSFLVVLGAFMLAKLVSLLPSALLMKLLISEEQGEALTGSLSFGKNIFIDFLSMGIVTAICEEIIFRGCIGNHFKKYGMWFAMICSSLFFALYHMNLFQFVSTFLPGMVLFYVAMNYSLKWSILLHFINNGVMSIATSILQKKAPESFAANYGEIVVEVILIGIGLALMKKDGAIAKVKEFMSTPKNEPGVYKAALGNGVFIALVLACLLSTVAIFALTDVVLPAMGGLG